MCQARLRKSGDTVTVRSAVGNSAGHGGEQTRSIRNISKIAGHTTHENLQSADANRRKVKEDLPEAGTRHDRENVVNDVPQGESAGAASPPAPVTR
jgi:hypothetical protein